MCGTNWHHPLCWAEWLYMYCESRGYQCADIWWSVRDRAGSLQLSRQKLSIGHVLYIPSSLTGLIESKQGQGGGNVWSINWQMQPVDYHHAFCMSGWGHEATFHFHLDYVEYNTCIELCRSSGDFWNSSCHRVWYYLTPCMWSGECCFLHLELFNV